MRALVAGLLGLAIVLAVAAPARAQRGFDHAAHDRALAGTQPAAVACTRCHPIKQGLLVGKPGHAACFGACHGAPPVAPARGRPLAIAADRVPLCTTCHAEATVRTAKVARAFAVAYPPYRAAPDFEIVVGHKRHAAVACAQCHVARPAAPHRRCAGCHDGAPANGPAMTACSGCHAPITARAACPDDDLGCVPLRVTSAFSHPRHAARGGAGATCATCHATIRASDDLAPPRPTMASCAIGGCHDGARAFATTEACTKCHRDVPAAKYVVPRPDKRFSHEAHLPRLGGTLACASCHPLGKTGEVAVAGHRACVGCHATDFGARVPRTCGACHNATEPWRPLFADRFPAERSEFGATLDHTKHATACEGCHVLTTTTSQLRPPRGHRACTGTGCHAPRSGAPPTLAQCEACHRRGLAAQRLADRLAAPWTVRARFDHARHQVTPDGAPLACTKCHDDLRGADVLALPTPRKSTCVPCHGDGQIAFKLTGTTCTRCHGGPR